MGNGCYKNVPPGSVSEPTVNNNNNNNSNNTHTHSHNNNNATQNANRRRVELSDFLSLDHPLNINRKYRDDFEILREQYVGQGIKKTHGFISKVSQNEIDRKRDEYWETRVEGSSAIWQALRLACEADEETAQTIISAVEIKLVNKTLQLSYDRQGNKYDVPIFCINSPTEFDLPKKKELKKEELSGEMLQIKFRRVGIVNDTELKIPNNLTGLELKQEFIKAVKEEGLEASSLRMFFGGKEISDQTLVAEYGLLNQHVVQIFKRKN